MPGTMSTRRKDGLGGGVDDRRRGESDRESEKERRTKMVETVELAFTSLDHLDMFVFLPSPTLWPRQRSSTPSPNPSFPGVDMREQFHAAQLLEAPDAIAEAALSYRPRP